MKKRKAQRKKRILIETSDAMAAFSLERYPDGKDPLVIWTRWRVVCEGEPWSWVRCPQTYLRFRVLKDSVAKRKKKKGFPRRTKRP